MYTIKTLVAVFLVGVILAGGVTFTLMHAPADPSGAAVACPGGTAAPLAAQSKDWGYTRPAPTTGGVRPTELQNHPQPIGSGH